MATVFLAAHAFRLPLVYGLCSLGRLAVGTGQVLFFFCRKVVRVNTRLDQPVLIGFRLDTIDQVMDAFLDFHAHEVAIVIGRGCPLAGF